MMPPSLDPAFQEYMKAHSNADTDAEDYSLHHTLGAGPYQAAKGNHRHDDLSPVGHDHNALYSLLSHNHNAAYSALGHTHSGILPGEIDATSRTAAATPSAFIVGITIGQTATGVADGWPAALGTWEVHRINDTRAWQIFNPKQIPELWIRSAIDANTWSSWFRMPGDGTLDLLEAVCSAAFNVPQTTPGDITGMSVTFPVKGPKDVFLITANLDVLVSTTGNVCICNLMVDGVSQTGTINIQGVAGASSNRNINSRQWKVTGLGAGNRIFKMQANKSGATGVYSIAATHSNMMVQRITSGM